MTIAAALAALALASSPPAKTAADAHKLAQSKSWDDLYLAFSSGDPKAFSDPDRKTISSALVEGAKALGTTDAVMAVSLIERAVLFQESEESLCTAATLEEGIQQNGEASKQLERAMALAPQSGRPHLLRAELAVKEGEPEVAAAQLKLVPKAYEAQRVKAALAAAAKLQDERKAGKQALATAEKTSSAPSRSRAGGPAIISTPSATDGAPTDVAPRAQEQMLDGAQLAGLREHAGEHFRFAYGTNGRDWGERADYEGKVEEALEEAWEFVGQTLHANRTQPVEVVLYTKEEYDFHFSGSELSRAAGFYSNKIRINGAEELTPDVRAVIVHEYTHAVIDELTAHHHIPQWANEGLATVVENEYRNAQGMRGADDPWRNRVKSLAAGGQLPHLSQLDADFLGFPNPRLAYVTAGAAMDIISEQAGMDSLVQILRDSPKTPFNQQLESKVGLTLDQLDQQVAEKLGH